MLCFRDGEVGAAGVLVLFIGVADGDDVAGAVNVVVIAVVIL